MNQTSSANVTARRPNLSSRGREARVRKLSGMGRRDPTKRDWWNLPKDQIAAGITDIVNRIDQTNSGWKKRMMRYARMYGNDENLGLSNSASLNQGNSQTNNLPTYNIIQSGVDTLASKIVRDDPSPYYITNGADYFTKLRAEKQTQFTQGVFYSSGLYALARNKIFRDAAVYGRGVVQFEYQDWTKDKKIVADWVFIDELKIDPFDSARGFPRSIHRSKMIQTELLLARFGKDPEKAQWIREASTLASSRFTSLETVIDWVVYNESWHLANGKDNPGRYVISLGDKLLLDEPYEYDDYSGCLAFFQYYQKPVGMAGRGIPETIQSGQYEINKILLAIQQCQELQARPLIFVDSDSKVSNDSLLNNRIARLIKRKPGSKIDFVTPQGAPPEFYSHLANWMNWCRQEIGITDTSQSGAVRPGVDSAVAMREQVDIESTRYVQVAKNWEQFFVDCAHVVMKLGKKAYDKDKTYSVRYYDKKYNVLRDIPWSKIAPEEDGYVIQCDTVSAFPKSAAGRIQTVTDFISNNFIGRERGLELLGLDPDLEGDIKLQTSTLRLVEKRLSQMVEDAKYFHPTPQMNLTLAQLIAEQTCAMLEAEDCPDERLDLVRQYITEIVTLKGGTDPLVAALQSVFAQPAANAPIAPQQGLAPANVAAAAA